MKQSDDAREGGARICCANEGAAGRKFIGDQKAASARICGCGGGFAISDEGDLMWTGRFESRDTDNFKRAIAFPGRSQMIRNI
jgi:hypothetical protein